jgi:hypothetical protein
LLNYFVNTGWQFDRTVLFMLKFGARSAIQKPVAFPHVHRGVLGAQSVRMTGYLAVSQDNAVFTFYRVSILGKTVYPQQQNIALPVGIALNSRFHFSSLLGPLQGHSQNSNTLTYAL